MENLTELKALLSTPRDIVILSHRNPDGDAIGSSLGLVHFLNKFGHTTRIIFPSDYPALFSWMPDADKIEIYDLDPERGLKLVEQAQIIFCLDFNSLDRIDKLGEAVLGLKVPKVMIDHHIDPEPFADFVLSDTSVSSTSELVFDFINMLGERKKLDRDIADCLYTGIVTDTGSFKFSTSSKLFRVVAELLELGIDDVKLQDLIFNSLPEKQLRLLGYCLSRRMEILEEYRTGIISLSKKDYEHFNIQRGDTEGIVNFMLKIKNIRLAAFITEQPTIVKISLRSKGNFSVQEIAAQHFKGGGHKNAAGGYSYIGLGGTIRKFKNILPSLKEQLVQPN